MRNLRVDLDAGHGGKNRGACHNGIVEADWNLNFVRYLRARLKHSADPIDIELIRSADCDLSLISRGIVSEEDKADVVLCIHVNAEGSHKTRGLTTFHMAGDWIGRAICHTIARAAPALLYRRQMVFSAENLPDDDRDDWKQRPLNVMERHAGHSVPVLVEVGYCSHAADAKLLKDPLVQSGLALACHAGLLRGARLFAG